jgi:hypothetical protein
MALRLSQSPSYKWPVKIVIPADGGRRETFTFDAVFRRLKQSRIAEIIDNGQRKNRGEQLEPGQDMSDMELLDEILCGWDGVVDDADEPIPFTRASLEQLCELPTVAGQIAEAWLGSLQKAKSKN